MHVVVYTATATFGGAEIVARLIVSRVPESDRVTVVGPTLDVISQIASGNPRAAVAVSPMIAGKHDVRSALGLRRMLRELQPDVIHFNLTDMASCLTEIMIAASLPDVALVAVEHSGYQPQTRFQRIAKVSSARLLDGHVAVSKPLGELVARTSHIAVDRVSVIANGVEAVDAYVRPRPVGSMLRLGVVSRLIEEKGIDLVIDALALVHDVELHVAGDGAARDRLAERAIARGVSDRVHFHGWMSDPSSVYRDVDLYVHPSRVDIMPLSVIEAMHHGLPVVATDVGSLSEMVISGETGFLFEVDDIAAFVRAIEEMRDDESRRVAYGRAGRERALANYGSTSMGAAYAEVYQAARRSREGRRFWHPRGRSTTR